MPDDTQSVVRVLERFMVAITVLLRTQPLEQLLHQPLTLSLPLRHKVGRRRCHEGRIVRLGRHRLFAIESDAGGSDVDSRKRDEMHVDCRVSQKKNLVVVHHLCMRTAPRHLAHHALVDADTTPAEREEPATRLIDIGTKALGDGQRVGA